MKLPVLVSFVLSAALGMPPQDDQIPMNAAGTSKQDVTAYLKAHNDLRGKHHAKALVWDENLASKAHEWASRCVFHHSGGSLGPYGENLAAGTGDRYDIAAAVKSWSDEAREYSVH
jgi:uncharacterized protein YkwD